MLPNLQRQIDQHASDPGSHLQALKLLLLQLGQRAHLVDLGLLHRELRGDRLLIDLQPLIFDIVARGQFLCLAAEALEASPEMTPRS